MWLNWVYVAVEVIRRRKCVFIQEGNEDCCESELRKGKEERFCSEQDIRAVHFLVPYSSLFSIYLNLSLEEEAPLSET